MVSDIDALMSADDKLRAAMAAGDIDTLATHLAKDLSWTHSSGKTDTKESFLGVFAAGTTQYYSLAVRDTQARVYGNIFVLEGVVFGDVTKDGLDKKLVNKFLTVWQKSGSGHFVLQAWQSTGMS